MDTNPTTHSVLQTIASTRVSRSDAKRSKAETLTERLMKPIAVHRTLLDIASRERINRAYGVKNRLLRSFSSSHGHDLVKQYDPISRKIVVGSPGTTTPTKPRAKQRSPSINNPHRQGVTFGREGSDSESVFSGFWCTRNYLGIGVQTVRLEHIKSTCFSRNQPAIT